jgi:hypothetical protein
MVNSYQYQLGMKRFNLHEVSSFENVPGEEEAFVCPGHGL